MFLLICMYSYILYNMFLYNVHTCSGSMFMSIFIVVSVFLNNEHDHVYMSMHMLVHFFLDMHMLILHRSGKILGVQLKTYGKFELCWW